MSFQKIGGLKLEITNRGYNGTGKIFISTFKYGGDYSILNTSIPKLWNDALFEMGMQIGNIVEESNEEVLIDADWIFDIKRGNLTGEILDLNDNNKVVAIFNTKKSLFTSLTRGNRADLFKNHVKVILNELLRTK